MNTNQQKRKPAQLSEDNLEQVTGGAGLSAECEPNAIIPPSYDARRPKNMNMDDSASLMLGMGSAIVIVKRPD